MGVKGLWPLLEPVGRRISVESLQNKRLAVDASIWLFQFIQAMRDERGDLLRNAHVLGFFRRISRLLAHRIRPVFVFDGATPNLKKQTTAARRRRREQQHAKLRKTAEKLLMNQLKQHALGQVTQAQVTQAARKQAVNAGSSRANGPGRQQQQQQQHEEQIQDEEQQETAEQAAARKRKGKAPLVAEDEPLSQAGAAMAAGRAHRLAASGEGPSTAGVAAAAGRSGSAAAADGLLAAQLNVLDCREGDGEMAAIAAVAAVQAEEAAGAASAFASLTQQRHQRRRQRQADGGGGSGSEGESGEEGDGEDLEIVVPEDGELDPEVLSRLPHSVAMDLIQVARERRRATNRLQLEQRSGVPASFSQFQMQQYLDGTKFRRRVEEVKDAMNSAATGGTAARRIAGEAGREYILQRDPEQQQQAQQAQGQQQQQQQQQQAAEGGGAGGAAGAAAKPTGAAGAGSPGEVQGVLDISFEVVAGEGDGAEDEDLGWEDVDLPAPGSATSQGGQGQEAQHWRDRAAARQRYWSLSHGFQMGRKLATWGEGEGEGPRGAPGGGADLALVVDEEVAVAEEEDEVEVVVGGGEGQTTPGSTRKALIARSPLTVSPARQMPVPEDEDGQLQEAIRLSLAEASPAAGWQRRRSGASRQDVLSPGASQMSLAAAADQLLQRQRGLQQLMSPQGQRQQPQALQEVQGEARRQGVAVQEEGQEQPLAAPAAAANTNASASTQDLDAAAAAAGPGSDWFRAGEEGESGSDAEVLWEEPALAAGAAVGAAGDQQQQQQQQQGPAGSSLLATVNRQSAVRLEEWLGGGASTEKQRPGGASSPSTQPTCSAAADDDGGMDWEDAVLDDGQAAAAPSSDVCLQDVQQQQQQQQQVSAVAAVSASGTIAHAAAAPSAHQPATVPTRADGAAASRQVRFSSTVGVRLLPSGQFLQQHEQEGGGQVPRAGSVSQAPAELPATEAARSPSPVPAAATTRTPGDTETAATAETTAEATAVAEAAAATFAAGSAAEAEAAAEETAEAAAEVVAAVPEAGGALVSGLAAAELAAFEALDDLDGEGAWEDVVSPSRPQRAQQATAAAAAGGPHAAAAAHPAGAAAGAAPGPGPRLEQGQEQGQEQEQYQAPLDFDAELDALREEERRLRSAQRAGRGQVETPTAAMYQDCMELLTMFGVPYIIAPQEAEAQCAWLDAEGLVDGVVTDDNDVFLFGARRVYRHIFENKRYVEEYRSQDVQSELGLGRTQLAALAQLLGSDYCEGVAGVGIVNAVEVVHAFPGTDGLQAFKDWLTAPDDQLLELARGSGAGGRGGGAKQQKQKQQGGQGRGKKPHRQRRRTQDPEPSAAAPGSSPGGPLESHASLDQEEEGEEEEEREGGQTGAEAQAQAVLAANFKLQHRGARRNWETPADFPSSAAAAAYAAPKVDTSKDKFTFARPDMELLREYCASRFGWTRQQADDVLEPVEKAFQQHQSQQTLDSFLTMRQRFAKIKSKRLQKAVAGIAGEDKDEIMLRAGEEAVAPPAQTQGSGHGRKRKAAAEGLKGSRSVGGRGRGQARGTSGGSGAPGSSNSRANGQQAGVGAVAAATPGTATRVPRRGRRSAAVVEVVEEQP